MDTALKILRPTEASGSGTPIRSGCCRQTMAMKRPHDSESSSLKRTISRMSSQADYSQSEGFNNTPEADEQAQGDRHVPTEESATRSDPSTCSSCSTEPHYGGPSYIPSFQARNHVPAVTTSSSSARLSPKGNPSTTEPRASVSLEMEKRKRIKLGWGLPVPQTTIAFNPADVVPPAEQAWCLLHAKFENSSLTAPLTFANDLDGQQIHGKFQFVDVYINREFTPVSSDPGCRCFQCDTKDSSCGCLQTLHYVRTEDDLTVLNPAFIDATALIPQPIIECNTACKCKETCINRVVQKGRTIPLQIFMTKHCGFGVRSPQPIKKGQFIDVYLGELLTTNAIKEYENASTEMSPSFVFSLDFFYPRPLYHVQANHFGSSARFINHSCNPNSRVFTAMMSRAEKKTHKLAYFAIQDIAAMKEITVDYSPAAQWVPAVGEDEEVERCLCKEMTCRGRVWPMQQAARRKGKGRAT